ncbi:MAG: Histone acetyltransferase HPA2 and related acetyltransferases, partial [uncultured Rubellimicrobium sp.]
ADDPSRDAGRYRGGGCASGALLRSAAAGRLPALRPGPRPAAHGPRPAAAPRLGPLLFGGGGGGAPGRGRLVGGASGRRGAHPRAGPCPPRGHRRADRAAWGRAGADGPCHGGGEGGRDAAALQPVHPHGRALLRGSGLSSAAPPRPGLRPRGAVPGGGDGAFPL